MSQLILVHIGYCFALEINGFQTIVIVLLLMKISLIVNFSFDEGCHFLSSFNVTWISGNWMFVKYI